jgi:hypothetical protein
VHIRVHLRTNIPAFGEKEIGYMDLSVEAGFGE